MTLFFVYSVAAPGEAKPHTIEVTQAGKALAFDTPAQIVIHGSYVNEWVAKGERVRLKDENSIRHRPISPMRYKRTPIRCVSTGNTYKNAVAAARALKITNAQISLHLNNPTTYPTAGGYTFERVL